MATGRTVMAKLMNIMRRYLVISGWQRGSRKKLKNTISVIPWKVIGV